MDTISLRSPDFGDARILETYADIRRTLSGELKVAAPWTHSRSLQATFKALSAAQKEALKTLLIANQGVEIKWIDPEGTEYIGVISTPVIEFVQEGRGCMWATSFSILVTQ
jgi:hypothetical protein